LNCTLATPTSSVASAATETTPLTVAPSAGEVTETDGGVVSAPEATVPVSVYPVMRR
jgi:hypothetical protein